MVELAREQQKSLSGRIFTDDRAVDRDHDALHAKSLSVRAVIARLLRDYVLARWRLLVFAAATMTFVAATTGALPFLMQRAADEIFVAKNPTMLYAVPIVVIVVIATVIVFLTELTSNTATCAIFLPVFLEAAPALGLTQDQVCMLMFYVCIVDVCVFVCVLLNAT